MQPAVGRTLVADTAALAVAVIWGTNNVVVKAALAGWVSPYAFNALRFLLGAVALTSLMLWIEPDWRLPKGLWWKVVLLGLVGNALNQALFITGISLTFASNAGIISAMIPILASLGGTLTGYDRATPRLWVGLCVSLAGVLLVTAAGSGGLGPFNVGDLLLFLGALTWAGYTIFASPLARMTSPIKVTAYGMLVASVVLVLVGLPDLLRQDWSAIPGTSWSGLLFAGLSSNALGYGLYVWAIQRIGATRTSLFINLSPLVTAVGAWLLLGERWSGLQWVGASLVMAGVVIARWEVLSQALGRQVA